MLKGYALLLLYIKSCWSPAPTRKTLACTTSASAPALWSPRIRETVDRAFSQMKSVIRANYSNPPAHGASVVATILSNDALRAIWEQELTDMRQRIQRMRLLFVNTLQEKGASRDFSFISQQNGMFSFSGLTKEQVLRLREEFAIYAVASGRINVAGMTPDNMAPLCEAIVAVL